jgi:hypothetical protein
MADARAAVAHVEIDTVEPARDHADHEFAGLAVGERQLVQAQNLVAAVAVDARCEHSHDVPPDMRLQNAATALSVA